jgi:hypothetical protein
MRQLRSLGSRACLLCVLAIVLLPTGARAQQPVYLSVLDRGGAAVTDLQPNEVKIAEDGVECKTVKLEPIQWPMKVTVLVDNGPAIGPSIDVLRNGLRRFFEELPEGVEASLLTIAPQPRFVVKPTTERDKLIKGIDLITPDQAAGLFFDALIEAGNRIEKDKTNQFPVIVMIGSDLGRNSSAQERDFQKLQKQVIDRAIMVHVIVVSAGGQRVGSVAGALQTEVGLNITKLSGGRYENIAAPNRLATLLPELGVQLAQSNAKQKYQYRVTYERPSSASKTPKGISAEVTRNGVAGVLSVDGKIPN